MTTWKLLQTFCFILITTSLFSGYDNCTNEATCCTDQEMQSWFFLDGEVLFWKPNQEAMTYGLVADAITDNIIFGNTNEAVQQESDWGLGFRVGAGYYFAKPSCDLAAYWTRFHHTMHSTTSTNSFILGTQLFFGSFLPIGGGALQAGPARSNWQLHIDLIELDFGYLLCFDNRFSLHPYIGLEGGWINQKQTIQYDQFLDTGNGVFFDSTINQINNFKGIGPKIGIDGDFLFGHGFGVLGNLAASFLYGSSRNPVKFHIVDPMTFPISDLAIKYKKNRLIPALQTQLGLNWGKECSKYFAFFISVSYEVQYFWHTWRNEGSAIQNIAVSDAGYSNLTLHGITGQLKLAF